MITKVYKDQEKFKHYDSKLDLDDMDYDQLPFHQRLK